MKMRPWILIPLLASAHAHAFEAVATVVSVSPVNETVSRPSQRCWTEYQQTQQVQPRERNYGGAIAGGIAGGLLGSLMGEGNGKVAAAAAAAGIGAIAGDRLANRDSADTYSTTTVPVQRCEQVSSSETRTTVYMVTYEYDGQRFMTRLPYNPGSQLRVNVSVTPK
jgi:uncharacterized protein YcfJ